MSLLYPRTSTQRLTATFAACALAFGLTACATSQAETKSTSGKTILKYQGGTGSVHVAELAEELGYFEHVELEWVGDVNGGPESIQATAIGETDFGGAFNGAIVKLRDSGAKLKAVISYYGSDDLASSGVYVLEDSTVQSGRDLIGKSIGVNTLGAQNEFVAREYLAREGLSNEEIEQVELKVIPPVSAEQVLRDKQVDAVSLGNVALDRAEERGGIRPLYTEVGLFGPQSFGTLVLREDFIDKNPEATRDFVQGVARAIRWTQTSDPKIVQEKFTQIITERGRNESADNIKFWKSLGVSTPGGVVKDEEYSVWLEWLKRNNELKNDITLDDLFTNEFNPYANGTFDPEADADGKPVPSN